MNNFHGNAPFTEKNLILGCLPGAHRTTDLLFHSQKKLLFSGVKNNASGRQLIYQHIRTHQLYSATHLMHSFWKVHRAPNAYIIFIALSLRLHFYSLELLSCSFISRNVLLKSAVKIFEKFSPEKLAYKKMQSKQIPFMTNECQTSN